MPTRFWMAASHTTGDDEWKRRLADRYPLVRREPGRPRDQFYPPLWELFRDSGIPFRLHWGKFQPVYERGDRRWVDFFAAHYPRWNDFLQLRAP